MRVITTFDPTAAASGSFNSGIVNQGSNMLVMNESSINLIFTFANGDQAQIPANWTRRFKLAQPNFMIFWKQQSAGGLSSIQPTNQVVVEIYEPFEVIPEIYPQVLVRQTNVGNLTPTTPPPQTTLADDGRTGGATPITIEAKQSGSSGSNLAIDNQGNITLAQWNGTTLLTIFQVIANAAANADNVVLSDSTHRTHVKGTLLVDLATSISGTLQVVGITTFLSQVAFVSGTLTRIAAWGPYTFTTTGTFFNHNLGVIPDLILMVNIVTTATIIHAGYDDSTLTATQFKAFANASGTFRGLALKF